jgi:hypothetical protein
VPATAQGSPQELVDDAFRIVEEAMVGEAQDPIAQGSQKDISVGVVRGLRRLLMNIAIELHDETEVVTAEIRDEGGNGELASELEAVKTAVASPSPGRGESDGRGGSRG